MIKQYIWTPVEPVQRGIKLLNKRKRGWKKKVNVEKLAFTMEGHPLVQIFGSFNAGRYWIASKGYTPLSAGFVEPWWLPKEIRGDLRELLILEWRQQLSE